VSDADCGANRICGFPEVDACGARGQCFPAPSSNCLVYGAGCACDGTTINIACTGLPTGYNPKPLLHAGDCQDAAAPCKASADCGATGLCGFPTSAACAALGQCFPRPQGLCDAYLPGCACDGTTINLICGGLPDGYAEKPVRNAGQCTDAGGTTCATSADCGSGFLCGFKKADACAAKGSCFQDTGQFCEAFAPGCACDGTVINIYCNNLPPGYESKPLAFEGYCPDAGH
jgi:hypothetical protein